MLRSLRLWWNYHHSQNTLFASIFKNADMHQHRRYGSAPLTPFIAGQLGGIARKPDDLMATPPNFSMIYISIDNWVHVFFILN
jgi:hypothetical protein